MTTDARANTPRTNAAEIDLHTHIATEFREGRHHYVQKYVPAYIARQLESELATARADSERMEDTLHKIKQWCAAYPITVFIPPDLDKARELLAAGGMTLDAISADAMRHVTTGIQKLIESARDAKREDATSPPKP